MSRALINRSEDLLRLRKEGYDIDVVGAYLLVKGVPYVTEGCRIEYGTLVSSLTLAGERTTTPDTHVVSFIGKQPCNKDGTVIQQIKHQESRKKLCDGVEVDRTFSNKPQTGFKNYFDKMTSYANILAGPAEALDPSVTAKTHVERTSGPDSPFVYSDTATSRAGIGAVVKHLCGHKIAIVGLGGTGSYVLDLVAKTPVSEVHLIDGDRLLQHNAFRSPGAAALSDLEKAPFKADYFCGVYSRMHRGIRAHNVYLDSDNSELLNEMDFVFLCLDRGGARRELIKILGRLQKPFIDVGMGVHLVPGQDALIGTLRVSTSTPDFRDSESRISQSDAPEGENEAYVSNIQVADLNSLNASLAVIRWKKLCGFYQDVEREHFTAYVINTSQLLSEDLS